MIIILLHAEQYTVATIIYCVYGEHLLINSSQFSEIKLTKPASGFNKAGEVDHFSEIYLHKVQY